MRLGTELAEIINDGTGKVKAIKTSKGDIIECEWVGLTAGVRPNVHFLKGSDIHLGRGVLINEYFQADANVYAIGDCAEFRHPLPLRKPIEQVWYTGKMHGETVALNITEKEGPIHPEFGSIRPNSLTLNTKSMARFRQSSGGLKIPSIGRQRTVTKAFESISGRTPMWSPASI